MNKDIENTIKNTLRENKKNITNSTIDTYSKMLKKLYIDNNIDEEFDPYFFYD
jgi:hypothetical protein